MTDIDFSTNEAKASYGVGAQMGEQLKGMFENASLSAAIAGMEDAFNGLKLRVSGDDINAAYTVIQQKIEEQKAAQAASAGAEGQAFLEENAKRAEITVTDTGLQYEVIEAGEGEIPSAASTVRTHYRGTLIDGTEFDSSYSRNAPAEFAVGGVIAGWTEALQLMPVGSKWKLYIPFDLAYGERGAGGAIGPYQALIFEIELLAIVG